MTLAITSIAVTAIICAIIRASASDADLLVASFMPFSLDLGMSHRCPGRLRLLKCFYSEHPSTIFALMTPQSPNIDSAKIV